jgi:CDP-glycerol glycerophosphotransferase
MKLKNINHNHRIQRVFLYLLAIILHPFLKVKKGRVLFIAYDGNQYSCNPRAISDFILDNNLDGFELFWLFNDCYIPPQIDEQIKIVVGRTLRALVAINTSEFVFTNKRTNPWMFSWIKKKGQKYIMTWHGRALKKCELDAIDTLGPNYLKRMKNDSAYCDLFLSDSRYNSNLYHKAFLYDGEILEKGFPRNDIFFDKSKHVEIKKKVFDYYEFNETDKVVLYAPTFRGKMNLDCYNIDWGNATPALEKMLGGKVKILIRLHPNFLGSNIDRSSLFSSDNLIEATTYNNINDLIIASDMMVSDYSSCMFDFAFTKRPCFIYATDSEKYERGYYLNLKELPFPFAENNDQFLDNIKNFDDAKYQSELQICMDTVFGSFDTGHASEAVVNWMKDKSII